MKKQALLLAAGLAVVSAGVASRPIYAEASILRLTNDNDKAIGRAIVDHATWTNKTGSTPNSIQYTTNYMGSGDDGLLYDGPLIAKLTFDCTDGNPLDGITDFSILKNENGFFREITEINLCGESLDAAIDYSTLPTTLTTLTVGDANTTYDMSPVEDSSRPKNISSLTNLQSIRLSGVPVGSLNGFKTMQDLRELHINYGGLTNIAALPELSRTLSGIQLKGNYINNISTLLTTCMQSGDCNESSWDSAYENQRYLNAISENTTVIPVSGDTASIPEYFTALYSKFYGYGEEPYKNFIETDGLTINSDYDTVTITGDYGILTIKDPGVTTRNKYTLIFDKRAGSDEDSDSSDSSDGSDNPDTGDSFSLAWVMGIAAVIMATTSFVIRSRR